MRYALLLVLVGLGLVYFLGQVGPLSWSAPTLPGMEATRNLGSSIGTAFERAADRF